jgi:hypothetical protein
MKKYCPSRTCSHIPEGFADLVSHHNRIQDHPTSYYHQFNIIVTGLDSIEARRWINATLVGMVDEDDPESLKPLIDGGTEGWCYFFLLLGLDIRNVAKGKEMLMGEIAISPF